MTKRSISYRLLKANITDPEEALKDDHPLEAVELNDAPENKRLFAGQVYNNPPNWISFFSEGDRPKLSNLYGGQAAAILFVRCILQPAAGQQGNVAAGGEDARWFAVCFGLAFHSLRPEALESQFGLRVALNRLAASGLKSVDTRRPEDATIQTRSQNSRTGEIFDFGVDADHIILQSITGKSSDVEFGGSLSGSDGLKLRSDVDYSDVDEKVSQILQAYVSEEYQNLFPWYGRITPVRDRLQIAHLDNTLVDRLRNGQTNGIHLAPPEIVDYQQIDAFKFSGEGRGDGHDELRVSDYLALFNEQRVLTLEYIKSDKVRVAAEDQKFRDRWPVYKCTCAEIEQNGVLYVLAAGDWYAVSTDFVERVNQEVGLINVSNIQFPLHLPGEGEGDYNVRAVANIAGTHLFDKNLINFQGERGRVEFCDILTDDRKIIHVKKRSRSSLLSHLFMQGLVSGEAFIDYPPLRIQIWDNFPGVQNIVPEDTPNTSDYEVVYALMHDGQNTLPFFSKVALVGVHRQLRRMRYDVSLAWIGPA